MEKQVRVLHEDVVRTGRGDHHVALRRVHLAREVQDRELGPVLVVVVLGRVHHVDLDCRTGREEGNGEGGVIGQGRAVPGVGEVGHAHAEGVGRVLPRVHRRCPVENGPGLLYMTGA